MPTTRLLICLLASAEIQHWDRVFLVHSNRTLPVERLFPNTVLEMFMDMVVAAQLRLIGAFNHGN
jgi:hypothetical protein